MKDYLVVLLILYNLYITYVFYVVRREIIRLLRNRKDDRAFASKLREIITPW